MEVLRLGIDEGQKENACRFSYPGADPGFGKGGFNLVPNSDTGVATNNDF